MADTPWRTISRFDPLGLTDATVELHHAMQLVAAAGGAFVPERDDDSHRAACWDSDLQAFVGAGFSPGYPFRIALRPVDLTLLLLERTDAVLGSLELAGHTMDDGYQWLGEAAKSYMGGGHEPVCPPPFAIPAHPVAVGEPFATGRQDERAALTALYGSAAEVLASFAAGRDDAAPVLCWPHHFDIGTVLASGPDDAVAPDRTVGIGMAPMGGGYDTWYWYVNAWPSVDVAGAAPFDPPGHWHSAGWTGVVLEAHEVLRDGPDGRGIVADFLSRGVDSAIDALTPRTSGE